LIAPSQAEIPAEISRNEISSNGRGLLVEDVPVRAENNRFLGNNGWAVHLDLRFVSSSVSSIIAGNTVRQVRSRLNKCQNAGSRNVRLSLPPVDMDVEVLGNVQEDGETIEPVVKRRRFTDAGTML